jgi:hypothetical protein
MAEVQNCIPLIDSNCEFTIHVESIEQEGQHKGFETLDSVVMRIMPLEVHECTRSLEGIRLGNSYIYRSIGQFSAFQWSRLENLTTRWEMVMRRMSISVTPQGF